MNEKSLAFVSFVIALAAMGLGVFCVLEHLSAPDTQSNYKFMVPEEKVYKFDSDPLEVWNASPVTYKIQRILQYSDHTTFMSKDVSSDKVLIFDIYQNTTYYTDVERGDECWLQIYGEHSNKYSYAICHIHNVDEIEVID